MMNSERCKDLYCPHIQCQKKSGHIDCHKMEGLVWDNRSVSVGPRCAVVRENGIDPSRQCVLLHGHSGSHGYNDDVLYNHYVKDVTKFQKLDVYRVLELFEVKSPAIQHAIKKLLAAGKRGSKTMEKDVEEAIISLERWQDMRGEDV